MSFGEVACEEGGVVVAVEPLEYDAMYLTIGLDHAAFFGKKL